MPLNNKPNQNKTKQTLNVYFFEFSEKFAAKPKYKIFCKFKIILENICRSSH